VLCLYHASKYPEKIQPCSTPSRFATLPISARTRLTNSQARCWWHALFLAKDCWCFRTWWAGATSSPCQVSRGAAVRIFRRRCKCLARKAPFNAIVAQARWKDRGDNRLVLPCERHWHRCLGHWCSRARCACTRGLTSSLRAWRPR